jgi:hypothetical protein
MSIDRFDGSAWKADFARRYFQLDGTFRLGKNDDIAKNLPVLKDHRGSGNDSNPADGKQTKDQNQSPAPIP